MMMDQSLVGKVSEGQHRAREKLMDRYFPDWRENENLPAQLKESNTTMSFAEHCKNRRLKLIEEEEAREGLEGQCPLARDGTASALYSCGGSTKSKETQSDSQLSGPYPGDSQLSGKRTPHDSNSVWNLLDAGFEQGSALFSVKDMCNVLRALDEEDQKQFSFTMTRVLAHGRYKEARCEGLFKALRKAHEAGGQRESTQGPKEQRKTGSRECQGRSPSGTRNKSHRSARRWIARQEKPWRVTSSDSSRCCIGGASGNPRVDGAV